MVRNVSHPYISFILTGHYSDILKLSKPSNLAVYHYFLFQLNALPGSPR